MNEIMHDVTGIAMAIVGVAILTVLVSRRNQTPQVVGSVAKGFGSVLSVVMGGAGNAPAYGA